MFMQIRGRLLWQCPGCLYLNSHHLVPLGYRVKCRNVSKCKRTWVVGLTLYTLSGGFSSDDPPDLIPLDGGVWRNGKIHKVLCDSCSDIIAEHAPPPVARWPSRQPRKPIDGFALPVEKDDKEEEEDGVSEDS